MACLLKLLTIEEDKSCIEFYDTILLQKLVRVYERVYEQVHGEPEASIIADCQSRNLERKPIFLEVFRTPPERFLKGKI